MPSIEMRTPASRSRSAQAKAVNFDPWSVFMIFGGPNALVERLDAELDFQRVRQPPCQHTVAAPVHDRHEVKKAPSHWTISDVGAPDLAAPVDHQPAEQVEGSTLDSV